MAEELDVDLLIRAMYAYLPYDNWTVNARINAENVATEYARLRSENALKALLNEPHHLGYPISARTTTYDPETIMVKRDWYDRLMQYRKSLENK